MVDENKVEDAKGVDIKIELNKDDVRDYIAKTIMESELGTALENAIKKTVTDMQSSYYENPIQKVVDKIVSESIHKIITAEYQDIIELVIREKLTQDFIKSVMEKAWEAYSNKLLEM